MFIQGLNCEIGLVCEPLLHTSLWPLGRESMWLVMILQMNRYFFYITSTKKYFHFQKVKSLYTYFFIIVSSNLSPINFTRFSSRITCIKNKKLSQNQNFASLNYLWFYLKSYRSIHDIPWIYFRKIKLNYLFSTRLRGRLGAKASLGFVASTIEIPSQSFPTKSDIDNFHPQKKRTDVTWKCRSGEY